jgi:hypothetical protein
MKTRHTKVTEYRKSGSVGRSSFSIFNFQFSIRIGKAFLVFIFYLLISAGTAAGQDVAINPVVPGTPVTVVVMGDSVKYEVEIASTGISYPTGRLKITLPAGFKLLPANIEPGTLANDGLSGEIVVNVVAGAAQAAKVAFYVQPLCNAATAVADNNLRKIEYEFLSSSPTVTKQTDPINNIYTPIFNVAYPTGTTVSLNTPLTRVIAITQTAYSAHVNNIRIDAQADTSSIVVTKIEVSKDNSSWTNITASALDTLTDRFVYTITRNNTFEPLAYAGKQLQNNVTLYVRETVILKKCDDGAGAVTYSISYGDGTTFCNPISTGNSNLSVIVPNYSNDMLNGAVNWPTSLSVDGVWRIRIINKSTNPNAVMKDLYMTFNMGHSYYIQKKAYLCDRTGAPILDVAGDTVWLDFTPGTMMRRIGVNLKSEDPAMQARYENIGFIDADGDGNYNDLNIQDTVHFAIVFNVVTSHLSTEQCHSINQFVQGTSLTAWGYYKDACNKEVQFGRVGNAGGPSAWYSGFAGGGITTPTLTPNLLHSNDKATLSFKRGGYESAFDVQHGEGGTSSLFVEITLPAGLDFDETAANPVVLKDNNGLVYPTSITPSDPYGGNIPKGSYLIQKISNQKIRLQILHDLHSQGTYIEIAVKANGNPDPTGVFSAVNLFDYGNAGLLYQFGCSTSVLDYIFAENCNDIEMKGVSLERTTFGYAGITKTTRITKADNPNVSVIYPFDSVAIYGQMLVKQPYTVASGDILKVSASYRSDASGTANAYLTKTNTPGKLRIYRGGALNKTLDISTNDITQNAVTSGAIHTQYIEADIAASLRTAGVTQLLAGDSISLVIYTVSNENLPRENSSAARPVTMKLYRNSSQICYPLIDERVTFVQYTFDYVMTDDGDSPSSWNERARSTSADLFYGVSNKALTLLNLLTPEEYRPNVDTVSNITFVYNCLIKVDSINLTLRNQKTGNETARWLHETDDYTVAYGGESTTVTINPLKSHMFPGTTGNWTGYFLYVYWEGINMSDNFYIEKTVSFTSVEYPTSTAPQKRIINNKKIGTDHKSIINFYRPGITSSLPAQSPVGDTVEWDLTILNNSAWASSDPVLPYTWIAFETPAGVTPSKLIDATTGAVVVAQPSDFLTYGAGFYWVKLGDVACPHNYKLQCTYTVCEGTPSFAVKVGMSKSDYPQDPQNGFAQSPYNSAGMPIHAMASTTLSFTPPDANFSGSLTHYPEYPDKGTNDFCDVIEFLAEYHNGLPSEISDLKLRIPLPAGFSYVNNSAQVKLGSGGAWDDPKTVSSTAGELNITLLQSSQKLSGYGTANASAYVKFLLKISCGAENRQQIYGYFSGKSGCNAEIVKTYNSGQVRIEGLPELTPYYVATLLSSPAPIYTGATPPNKDGSFTIEGYYNRQGSKGDADMQAIVDLPANLTMVQSSAAGPDSLAFTQSGVRLTAILSEDDDFNKTRYFKLTFKPSHPELWREDTVQIKFHASIEQAMFCDVSCPVLNISDTLRTLKFAMQMLDIDYDDSIVAVSRRASSTAEHVEITGWLVSSDADVAFDAGTLKMELWTRKGTSYTPVASVDTPTLTVSSVAHGSKVQFVVKADVANSENICDMLLVLRKKTGAGASNPYLSDSAVIAVPNPRYKIMTQPDSICQMAVNTSIGEASIAGYGYLWEPVGFTNNYLSSTHATPVNFTYDYKSKPVANDTVLKYLVTITRPNGCTSADTVYVPLKGIPSVDNVSAKTVCNGGKLNVAFADATNTSPSTHPTEFDWVVKSGSVSGLPTSGNGSIVNLTLTNTSKSPMTATVSVTPTKNNCTGESKEFTVTVNPTPDVDAVSPQTVCSGEATTAINFGTTISNAVMTYAWKVTENASAINLASSGTGNITSFTTKPNTGTSPIVVKFEVTPKIGSCSGTSKTFTVTVNPVPRVNATPDTVVCSGGTVNERTFATTNSPTTLVSYSWEATDGYSATNLSSSSGNGAIPSFTVKANNTTSPIVVEFVVTPKIETCVGTTDTFTVTINPVLRGGKIDDDQIICYNTKPAAFTSAETASGGVGAPTYIWQWSDDAGATWTWHDIASATSEAYTHDVNLMKTTKFRRRATNGSCGTAYSDTVTVTVRHPSLYDYPDLRIRVCPDGSAINLSKYVDTLDLNGPPQWEKLSGVAISSAGVIAANALDTPHNSVMTFTYKVSNPCASDITRKVYVEVLKAGRMRPLRDTIVICADNADAINVNQIFGIEAGGTWSYYSHSANDIHAYVKESHSSTYGGAVVLNGKALYNSGIASVKYHGVDVKKAVFTYTSENGSCLGGKSYKIVIILTQ